MDNLLKKEIKTIKKNEEKIVFKIHNFKVKKKTFLSIILSVLVMMVGLQKVESLHEIKAHVSLLVLLVTLIVCSIFLFLTVVKKNMSFYIKQISFIFIGLLLFLWLFTLNQNYNLNDIVFVSIIVTTIAASIYDTF